MALIREATVYYTSPAGKIAPHAGSTAPTGWLLCDGSVVSQTTYALLYNAIGTAYNTGGEGVGNFRLPDLRGKIPVGKNAGTFATLGASSGVETVTLSSAQIPGHSHSGTTSTESADHSHSGSTGTESTTHGHSGNYTQPAAPGSTPVANGSTGSVTCVASISTGSFSTGGQSQNHTHSFSTGGRSAAHTHSFTTDNGTGGGTSHTNLQPYQVTNYIIKY